MPTRIGFRCGVVIFGLVLVTTGFFWWVLSVELLHAWLVAVNLIAFLTYGYDKWAAISSMRRIPETVLLGLALVGGVIGALLGMLIFKHKISKSSFKTKLLAVILLQVVLFAVYYLLA